jgi:hypothetical protein
MKIRLAVFGGLALALGVVPARADGDPASPRTDLALGRLPTGTTVAFTPLSPAGWGVAFAGGPAPRVVSERPARFEVFASEDDIRELASGYGMVARSGAGIEAHAAVAAADGVAFQVLDRWRIDGAVVSVSRTLTVTGRATAGFASSIVLALDPAVGWRDVQLMAPGAAPRSPCSTRRPVATRPSRNRSSHRRR